MVNYCPNCGWRVNDPQRRKCDNCGEPLPGRGSEVGSASSSAGLPPGSGRRGGRAHVVTQNTRYTWHDSATGEKHTAKSLDEMPPDPQADRGGNERIEAPREVHPSTAFRGPSGEQLSYDSLDEMPPEIRRFFERVQRGEDPLEQSD